MAHHGLVIDPLGPTHQQILAVTFICPVCVTSISVAMYYPQMFSFANVLCRHEKKRKKDLRLSATNLEDEEIKAILS